MKGRIRKVILQSVLIIIGFGILFYPVVTSKWNGMRQKQLTYNYQTAVSEQDSAVLDAMRLKAKAYNEQLVGSSVPDIFVRMAQSDDAEYASVLDPNKDGIMGYIEIPGIDVELPIYHGTADDVLEKGAGHLPGSSLPVGGNGTHAVISAHRGLPTAAMFTELDRLSEGNQFYLHVLGDVLAYEVDQVLVVDPDETQSLAIDANEDLVTLVTCTPYGVNTQRLLVRGHRIPYEETSYAEESAHKAAPTANSVVMRIICVVIGIALGTIIALIISIVKRKGRKK